ncbi:alpha/beta hydrolase-fold protein [soil metagenome]|jgi:esterase/lipase superfamily enzyme|nr:esterase [Deinococcota bacterium]
MNREYHRWHSPSLGRDMELLVFGHAGARVLVFPTSQGRFFEWEGMGMVGALSEHLERGWIQLYCVDSVDSESWYARWKWPGDRAWRQVEYEHYLLREVLPLSARKNGNPFLITTGASFGAYHAANLAFRHAHLVNRLIGLSGIYDIRRWADGHYDDNVYFNNPPDYLANERDPGRLAAMRRQDIILVTGEDDSHRHQNEQLSSLLWSKGVGNALRLWDGWSHDWPYWQKMIRHYIGGSD